MISRWTVVPISFIVEVGMRNLRAHCDNYVRAALNAWLA